MASEIPGNIVELTGFEKACCVFGNWMTICHAAHLTGDPTIISKNIHQAILYLIKRYPRMRAEIRNIGYQHHLHILNFDEQQINVNLFYSIVNPEGKSWQTYVENGCDRNPFKEDGKRAFPLFHFMLLVDPSTCSSEGDTFHLLLFHNHAASDGRSGFIILNDFFNFVTSENLNEHVEPVNTDIIPCMTRLMPRPFGFLFPLMSWIGILVMKSEAKKLRHAHIPVKPIPITENSSTSHHPVVKSNFLFSSTSSTLFSRLHSKCRSEQVTLQGPLAACLLIAIDHCFPKNKNDQKAKLIPHKLGLAIDMRSRLSGSVLSPNTVGFCVGVSELDLKGSFSYDSTRFWTLAERCVRATNKSITNGDPQKFLHIFNGIIDNQRKYEQLLREYPNGHTSEIALSNIGKYPFPSRYNNGQLKLNGLHVVNSSSSHYSTAIFFITCVDGGALDISLVHVIANQEKAKELFDCYIRILEICADASTDINLTQLKNLV